MVRIASGERSRRASGESEESFEMELSSSTPSVFRRDGSTPGSGSKSGAGGRIKNKDRVEHRLSSSNASSHNSNSRPGSAGSAHAPDSGVSEVGGSNPNTGIIQSSSSSPALSGLPSLGSGGVAPVSNNPPPIVPLLPPGVTSVPPGARFARRTGKLVIPPTGGGTTSGSSSVPVLPKIPAPAPGTGSGVSSTVGVDATASTKHSAPGLGSTGLGNVCSGSGAATSASSDPAIIANDPTTNLEAGGENVNEVEVVTVGGGSDSRSTQEEPFGMEGVEESREPETESELTANDGVFEPSSASSLTAELASPSNSGESPTRDIAISGSTGGRESKELLLPGGGGLQLKDPPSQESLNSLERISQSLRSERMDLEGGDTSSSSRTTPDHSSTPSSLVGASGGAPRVGGSKLSTGASGGGSAVVSSRKRTLDLCIRKLNSEKQKSSTSPAPPPTHPALPPLPQQLQPPSGESVGSKTGAAGPIGGDVHLGGLVEKSMEPQVQVQHQPPGSSGSSGPGGMMTVMVPLGPGAAPGRPPMSIQALGPISTGSSSGQMATGHPLPPLLKPGGGSVQQSLNSQGARNEQQNVHMTSATHAQSLGSLPPEQNNADSAGSIARASQLFLEKFSDKVKTVLDTAFAETLSDLQPATSVVDPAVIAEYEHKVAEVKHEMRALRWMHHQSVNELRTSTKNAVAEAQSIFDLEKQRLVDEMKRQFEEELQKTVQDAKSKQWCANCGKEAVFYCCWNTSYCDYPCQQCANCGKEAVFYCCWNTSYCDYPCQQSHWPKHMESCGQIRNSGGGGGPEAGGNNGQGVTAPVQPQPQPQQPVVGRPSPGAGYPHQAGMSNSPHQQPGGPGGMGGPGAGGNMKGNPGPGGYHFVQQVGVPQGGAGGGPPQFPRKGMAYPHQPGGPPRQQQQQQIIYGAPPGGGHVGMAGMPPGRR